MTSRETILYSKLPIEEQCTHKLWKVRLLGYEEANKLFRKLDKNAPEWNTFSQIIKLFVIDCNTVAQEKGLEATLMFFKFSATTGCMAKDVMSGLITTCYGAPKARIKDIAIQITLMLIEIEKQDIVIAELVRGMDHTFSVIVSTCIKAATQAIKKFGSEVLNVQPLLKKLRSLLEDKDKIIKDEAKLLAFEIYSWIGPTSFKAYLIDTKCLQIKALETEFEKLYCNKPQPTRFLRSKEEQKVILEEVVFANGVCNTSLSGDPSESEKEISDDKLKKLTLTFCSYDILNGSNDANWKTRLSPMINQIELPPVSSQVLIKLLNKKFGIKDNNAQVQKLKLECLKKVIEKLPKTSISLDCCVQDISSLLGDYKNGTLASEVLTTLTESIRLDIVSSAVLDYAFTVQITPKFQIDALNWLSGANLDLGFIIEMKPLMKCIINAFNSSNAQVKMALISLFDVMYLYMGYKLSLFFENVKPTLVQQLNEEFEKHHGKVLPKPISGKKIEGSTKSLEVASGDGNQIYRTNIQDIVLRVDITRQINDALITNLSHKNWTVRFDAVIKLQNIINEAKFITNKLGVARIALRDRIIDSNVNIGATAINLMESITKAMGPTFKTYIKYYLPSVLMSLGDQKTFKFQSTCQFMDEAWAEVCGYSEFFESDILFGALKSNSVSLKSELWTWLAENLPLVPLKAIPTDDLKRLLPFLYAGLEDRNIRICKTSENALYGFMMHLGYAYMYGACDKLEPTSVEYCKEKLDKVRHNLPTEQSEKPEVVFTVSPEVSKETKILSTKTVVKSNKENGIPHLITTTVKEREVENEPLFQQNNLKLQRDMDEHKLKFFKWNFTPPSNEFVKQLREQMLIAGVNKVLINNMFHSDFKYQLKAINVLLEDLVTAKDNNLALINNLDLVLKWITMRLFDANPLVLTKCLDYLEKMLDVLLVQNYNLLETEASSFVPYLITKLGYPNESVRNRTQVILKQIAFVFPLSKMYQYIIVGIKSKNSRQRSECLKHLTTMVEDYGTSIFQPNVPTACKEIAKCLGDRDNSVRTSALNCFVAAYFLHGDAIFKFVANIPEKDMGLLRERLRKAVKNPIMPVATVQPNIAQAVISTQHIFDADDTVDDQFNSDRAQSLIVSHTSMYEPNPQSYSIDLPSCTDACTTGSKSDSTELSQALNTAFSEDVNTSYKPRFSLDESFIQELDAEVILKPELSLKTYNWADNKEVDMDKTLQEQSCFKQVNSPFSKPCLNVKPYSSKTVNTHPRSPPVPVDHIQQLLAQMTSEDRVTSSIAIKNLDKMLLNPDIRSEFLEGGKVLPLFTAIIERFDMLSKCYDIGDTDGYKKISYFCFHLFKFQEFMTILSEQIIRDLLSKLLYLLTKWKPVDTLENQKIKKCMNNLTMSILERSAHTPVTCALLGMFYDMANYPQNFTTEYKDLLMKCLWKIIKDFHMWGDDLCYDLVLSNVHKFIKKFGTRHWKNQPSDIPLRTCKTLILTLVQLRTDKVLAILASPEFPIDSEMVVYIHKLIRHMNKK